MTVAVARGRELVVEAARYRLAIAEDNLSATLRSPQGEHWLSLRLLAAFDTLGGRDETLDIAVSRTDDDAGPVFEVDRRSTVWERAGARLRCRPDRVEVDAWVEGHGDLGDVSLLGGRSLVAGAPTGFLPSGSSFRTLFTPSPDDPGRILRSARENAVVGVSGDDEPGRGHWFFTPAPLCFALTTEEGLAEPDEAVESCWLAVSLAAPVTAMTFVQVAFEPADRAFSLRCEYEGHTRVDGLFRAPTVVLAPAVPDPYAGLRGYREDLEARGHVPDTSEKRVEEWWLEPIFCGWGAQCHLAATRGGHARDYATHATYDDFLAELEDNGVVPGTVVVDDKWQAAYGTCVPDEEKWPDLASWIADRHERGQRVLLWWKAWDPEGLPDELATRAPDGRAVALDPTNAEARAAIEDAVARMLGRDDLDADGLKIDFTAKTPSGSSLAAHGREWGVALLHLLLATVYAAAKRAKPDSLVVTQTPHPAFTDVTDMVRLNDLLRLKDLGPAPDVVRQMRHRARVVAAACPGTPIDTDDWCAPDRKAWRDYLAVKPELGVPALYYASHLDRSGERLTADDYEALRRAWACWRSTQEARAAR